MQSFLPNKVYDILKWINAIALPATILCAACIIRSVSDEGTAMIVMAIGTAINTWLGSMLGVSNAQYNQEA